MKKQTSYIDEICSELTTRICSGELAGGDIIREDELAREFSLSRTPIRQVLHKLALQHFVETKTGVGTIIVPADRYDLVDDLRTCRDLLQISAKRNVSGLGSLEKSEIAGLNSLLGSLAEDPSAALYWELVSGLNQLVASKINHDLLRETFALLSSRIYRRVLSLYRDDLNTLIQASRDELSSVQEANDAASLILAKASAISKLKAIVNSR